jgi:hypothetical protein
MDRLNVSTVNLPAAAVIYSTSALYKVALRSISYGPLLHSQRVAGVPLQVYF